MQSANRIRRAMMTAAAAIALGLSLAVPASAASAATTAPGSPHMAAAGARMASAASAAVPANDGDVVIILKNGVHTSVACNEGTDHSVGDNGNITEAFQDCGVRVWFYREANEKGNAVCINNDEDWFPEFGYLSYWISFNSAAC